MLITQYFTIPDSTCFFTECKMYLGTTLNTSVTVTYSRSGSTATVVFEINTS